MSEPIRSPIRVLVRTLMEAERVGDPAHPQGEAVELVLRAVAARISPLMGNGGFNMLLQRALKRAQGEHPCLGEVEARHEADPYLAGMEYAAQSVSPEEGAAAAEAVITELFGLLARFIGADMTIQLIRQSFPHVNHGGTETGQEEGGDA